jgi:hypothetical protein
MAVDFDDEVGGGAGEAGADDVDRAADHVGIAEDAAVAEALGGDEVGVGPGGGELLAVAQGDLLVAAVVDDEQAGVAPAREAIEADGVEGDARAADDVVLEEGAVRVVEADEPRELRERVVDEDVGRDHHVARRIDAAARVREQDGGRAERVGDDRVQRPDGVGDGDDRIGVVGQVQPAAGRVAVRRRVERDDGQARRDERLDERAELRAAPLPAVDEEDGGADAPAPRDDARGGAAPDRRAQRDVDGEPPAAREDGALALGTGVAARRDEQSFGDVRAESVGEDVRGLQRRAF